MAEEVERKVKQPREIVTLTDVIYVVRFNLERLCISLAWVMKMI